MRNNYKKQLIWGDVQIGIDVLLMLSVFISLCYWLKPQGAVYIFFSLIVMAVMALYTRSAKRELRVRMKSQMRMEAVLDDHSNAAGSDNAAYS